MSKRVNACVDCAGHHKCRDDLARKLRNQTADLFAVGKTDATEHRRLMWTTHQNPDLWFSMWKNTVIDLGFGREALPEDQVVGEMLFCENQTSRIVNSDETDGSLDNAAGNKGGRPPVDFTDPTLSPANKRGHSSAVICDLWFHCFWKSHSTTLPVKDTGEK